MALTQTQVSQLYVSIFNRASEGEGNTYWQKEAATKADAANYMLNTPDAKDYFGAALDDNQAFIETIYKNTLNKELADDEAGIKYWVDLLESGMSRGEVVAALIDAIEDYKDSTDPVTKAAYDQFNNRVEVSNYMAKEVEKAPADYKTSTQFAPLGDLVVTSDPKTIETAEAAVDKMKPVLPGETFELTSGTDKLVGTDKDDFFDASIAQNSFTGGVSNTLSSADRLDGGAGTDTLHAELVAEFVGATSGDYQIDVQPKTTSIENVTFEARDAGSNVHTNTLVTVDAKYMYGVEKIGSKFSDGDLIIENLTTLKNDGLLANARNTSDLTIIMDHTDNFNSDGHPSDLTVLFDEDYLLAGKSSESSSFYFLLDEDAELAGNQDRLANINVDGIQYSTDGGKTVYTLEAPEAQTAGTHAGFVAALQVALAEAISEGKLPEGSTLTLDTTNVDYTYLDNGERSAAIPAIVLTSGDGSVISAQGFSQVQNLIGDYDVYGRTGETSATNNDPISINVELEKVGRDGEGGNLVIGGKDQNLNSDKEEDSVDGITKFDITVLGNVDQPSNLGFISSTDKALTTVNIKSQDRSDSSYAALTIRDAFNGDTANTANATNVETVNANAFKGNLTIGTDSAMLNVDTFTAVGGGVVTLNANIDGNEQGGTWSYTTGEANDVLTINVDGDAVDALGESFTLNSGAGNDTVKITGANDVSDNTTRDLDYNSKVTTGAGEDTVYLNTENIVEVKTGADSDFVVVDADNATGTGVVNAVAQVVTITKTALTANAAEVTTQWQTGDTINYILNGTSYTYTVVAADLDTNEDFGAVDGGVDDLFAKLAAHINTNSGGIVTAVATNGNTITVTATTAGTPFSLAIAHTDSGANGAEALGLSTTTANVVGVATANGTVGTWTIGTGTGTDATDSDWDASVLYKATLTVDFAGFTSTVTVDTDAAGNFIATQKDINDAVIAAIAANPELARLLTTKVGTGSENNQMLTITSTVQGANDLTISVNQPTLVAAAGATAGQTTINSGDYNALEAGLIKTGAVANSGVIKDATQEADLITELNKIDGNRDETGAATANNDGTDFVLDRGNGTDGTNNTTTTSNAVIDLGTGANDLVVLDSGVLSSDTVVFSAEFGKVSIVNFFDAVFNTGAANNTVNHTDDGANVGDHILDFTAWLNDSLSASGSAESAVRVATKQDIVATTADLNLNSNEVVIVNDWTAVGTETFASMTAAAIDASLEGTEFYGSLVATTAVAAGATNFEGKVISSILMIENDANQGEYKVFNVETDSTKAAGSQFTVSLLGIVDFGESYTTDSAGAANANFA